MAEPRKPKVVVLGGGVGAMTAAFQLSAPGWRDHFESITVYQLGWRLGGKGASGRKEEDHRITEHGLHIWLGFYENAFRMLRECYAERGAGPGTLFQSVEDAFERASTFVIRELTDEGWKPWVASFPEDDQKPGDPDDPTPLPTVAEYLRRSVLLAVQFLVSVAPRSGELAGASVLLQAEGDRDVDLLFAGGSPAGTLRQTTDEARRALRGDADHLVGHVLSTALTTLARLGEEVLEEAGDQWIVLDDLVAKVVRRAKDQLRGVAFKSDAGRRSWYLADILLACARGILQHGLLDHPDGFDAIDNYDFADWLEINGADPESARCALIKAVVYDIAFAYRDGDSSMPSFSAAVALRGLFRWFFTYKGAIAWRMQAGMGDVVFAPLYEVMERRGVEFRFFHRVDALRLTPDRRSIATIQITEQAKLKDPGAGYKPLLDVHGLSCWPAEPLWDQLADGARLRAENVNFESFWCQEPAVEAPIELEVQDDFVVFGISLGAVPFVCADLVARNSDWQNMVQHVATVRTQAFQLWLNRPMSELTQMGELRPIMGGYVEPFDTCADMSHLIEREDVNPTPKSIAYFCNAMPTPGPPDPSALSTPADAHHEVRQAVLRFLQEDLIALWPGAVQRYPTDFLWDLLVAPEGIEGPARLDAQFWKANVDPSDRYVLSLPGTLRYRLWPGDSGYSNLVLAGDWTRCGLNAGCVEGAVISGMLAANSIQGWPPTSAIIGFDHP